LLEKGNIKLPSNHHVLLGFVINEKHRPFPKPTTYNVVSAGNPRELFVRTIRLWGALPDPEGRTFKQIASMVLGLGTAIIGRTMVDFRDYFYQDDGGCMACALEDDRAGSS
jgi:hypothetical protein